jgi:hypothetical protein
VFTFFRTDMEWPRFAHTPALDHDHIQSCSCIKLLSASWINAPTQSTTSRY